MKISRMIALLTVIGTVAVAAVAPTNAGTLEEDRAWVQAQADAGLRAAQANLDAAFAEGVRAAAARDA